MKFITLIVRIIVLCLNKLPITKMSHEIIADVHIVLYRGWVRMCTCFAVEVAQGTVPYLQGYHSLFVHPFFRSPLCALPSTYRIKGITFHIPLIPYKIVEGCSFV